MLDDLKNIENKVDLSPLEPFKLMLYGNFAWMLSSKENRQYYDDITKEYDSYFEFHNLMLLEHKIKILADIVFEKSKDDKDDKDDKDNKDSNCNDINK